MPWGVTHPPDRVRVYWCHEHPGISLEYRGSCPLCHRLLSSTEYFSPRSPEVRRGSDAGLANTRLNAALDDLIKTGRVEIADMTKLCAEGPEAVAELDRALDRAEFAQTLAERPGEQVVISLGAVARHLYCQPADVRAMIDEGDFAEVVPGLVDLRSLCDYLAHVQRNSGNSE